MTIGDRLKDWKDWFIENLCLILVFLGCALGIHSMFVNWETFSIVTTTGFDFSFGASHDMWFDLIAYQSYIPLAILICSVVSLVVMIYNLYRGERMNKIMIALTVCGIIMLFLMTYYSGAGFMYDGKWVYFANYLGLGFYFAWDASGLIMIGGGLYVASEVLGGKKNE